MKLQTDLYNMNAILSRRQTVRFLASACLLPLAAACGTDSVKSVGNETNSDSDSGTNTNTSTNSDTGSTGSLENPTSCSVIPEETAGPYPGDGSNGPNALSLANIIRQDIRSSIGTLSGTATGVALTVRIKLVNFQKSCGSLEGFAIYLWHCDKDGKYSLYNLTSQNYLRGVQVTDSEGTVSFTTIFPGCYAGRMPHMHFEIYPSAAKATHSSNKIKTSQLAFPNDVSEEVYARSEYGTSARNFSSISFATDNVFRDGYELQIANISGSISEGLVADLIVAISI